MRKTMIAKNTFAYCCFPFNNTETEYVTQYRKIGIEYRRGSHWFQFPVSVHTYTHTHTHPYMYTRS